MYSKHMLYSSLCVCVCVCMYVCVYVCVYIYIYTYIYAVLCLMAQSCLTLQTHDCKSPVKNTGVGWHVLLQWIFPIQGSNPGHPHCRWILYSLSHHGSPRILEWVVYPFSSDYRARHPAMQSQVGLMKHHYEQSLWRWWNSSWAISNPKRWCCESAALNMPANLENSAVATGLEMVSFHSNPKERQSQRMLKLLHNCTHLTG